MPKEKVRLREGREKAFLVKAREYTCCFIDYTKVLTIDYSMMQNILRLMGTPEYLLILTVKEKVL